MQTSEVSNNPAENNLAHHAYISGLAGLLVIIIMGFIAAVTGSIDGGWRFFSWRLTDNAHQSMLLVLAMCALVMFIIEMIIRYKKEKKIIRVSPKIIEKRYALFFAESFLNYVLDIAVLFLALFFFRHANEYGFMKGSPYYQPFFLLMNIYWELYVLLGLPYTMFTRALQYDPVADRREPAYLLLKAVTRIFSRFNLLGILKKYDLFDIATDENAGSFGSLDKKILLGVFVKMFFVPLMTVFFVDQFSHLVRNWSYLVDVIAGADPNIKFRVGDFYNVLFTMIMSVDVGVAWCGYTISTRWLKNTCISVEPTVLGWLVALLCYPPFQHYMGIYFTIPSEKGFMSIPYPWVVAIFAIMSILSYIVYMSATVVFGMRFSNLTHRGIITTGAFAYIRHPAYAAKNFSWWCVMMPFVIYQAISRNSAAALVQIIGLIGMTGLYYLRAITEERHLSIDPDYQEYCKRVPYRFIPKIL